jgi:hypothetical protein
VVNKKRLAADFRRRAAEARRMADEASNPSEKLDLREVERRWLRLAQNHEAQIGTRSKPRCKDKAARGARQRRPAQKPSR